jgi:hypothetical protein
MAEDRIARRNKLRETLAELRNTALAELEHRGYEVRGKTPGEIQKLLKSRRAKQKSKARVVEQQVDVSVSIWTNVSAPNAG